MTLKLALTGSIGMGKSTVAAMFRDAGIPVFDADAEVRRLEDTGGTLVEAIRERWPEAVVNGAVDRALLGALVLGDRDALAALEVIVHPAVHEAREQFIRDHSGAPALLFEIPLLFEAGSEREFDKIIVASAPAHVQRRRVLDRPGMTAAKLAAILGRQLPDADKRARADFVVDTGTDLASTRAQVHSILACLGLPTGG